MSVCPKCRNAYGTGDHEGMLCLTCQASVRKMVLVPEHEHTVLRAEVARLTKQLATLRAALPVLVEEAYGYRRLDMPFKNSSSYAKLTALLSEDTKPPTTV